VARRAKALGAKCVIDTSGAALEAALDEGVTLINPNLVELIELSAAPLESDGERVAACRALIADKRAEIVALTLGDDGALLVTGDRAWRAEPMAIEVVSTVGAGDSFLGGLVAALAAGKPLEQAFRMAVAAGSAAVLTPGTELCHEEDVMRLLRDVRINEVAEAAA
jgi:6-phosphofructokinase 2